MNPRRIAPIILSALACATVAHTQTTTGGVRGSVATRAGKAIQGATVQVRNQDTGMNRTMVTTGTGEFSFVLLPVGSYEVTVSAPGMKTLKDSRVQVSLGQNTTANFRMDSAEAGTTVEVVAAEQLLDTQQLSSITTINEQMVKAVPLNGRNFTDLALLTPGVTDAPDNRVSAEGARGIQNNLSIDGASFNSKFFGEQRGSTRIPFAFGADTIQELQVITNAYDAQYGNAAGAIINAVSKTGSNDWHGSFLYQARPESMVAKIRPVPYDPNGTLNTEQTRTKKFSQYAANINVGGPLIKDKLHFFAGVETFRYKEDYRPAISTSSANGNTQADLDNFLSNLGNTLIVAPGRTYIQDFNRTYTNDRNNTVFFGRLDWTINSNHTATLRLNSQNWRSVNGTTTGTSTLRVGESNNGIEENRSLSWVAELRSIFGANLVNEARLQIANERRPRLPQTYTSSEISVNGFVAGQNEFLPNGLDEKSLQLIDNLTYTRGEWTLKTGVDLQSFDYLNQFFRRQNGQWSFSTFNAAYKWMRGTDADLTLSSSNPGFITYQQGVSDVNGYIAFKSRLDAFYLQAQNAGLLDRKLLLSFGLRLTRESVDTNPRPNANLAGTDSIAASTAADPRLGFTYDLFGNGKTILRGGYGHFTSPDPDLTVSNTMFGNGFGVRNYSVNLSSSNRSSFVTGGILSASQRIQGGSLTRVDPSAILTSSTFTQGTLTGQVWDPDNKMPLAKRASIGVEQDASGLLSGLKLGARVTWAKFLHLQYFININLWQVNPDGTFGYYNDGYPTKTNKFTTSAGSGGQPPTARPGFAIVRGRRLDFNIPGLNQSFGNVFLSKNDGEGSYKSLVLQASRSSEEGFGFTGSLTFSKAEDNNSNERTTTGSDSNTANPADPLALIAPSANDRRFRAVFATYFPVYWGIKGSTYISYATGRPYSAFDTRDLNTDTQTGNDLAVDFNGRNGYRQPSTRQFDLRLTRPFQVSKSLYLEASIDVFNVFNWANQTTTLQSARNASGPIADFGFINNPDRNTREVQFAIRARF
ncbi:MAG: TonB-dependent receptor [Acidobacteria bacterium]|nr:TonB-dependent receptor [Acidobacteriota bacterium]